jgi:hypothetical protein
MSFAPTDIAGLVGWYDPSDASNITVVSGKISQLSDKSTAALHLAQSNAALRPIYNATGINSKPVVEGDGTNRYLLTSGTAQDISVCTIFMVIKQGATPTQYFLSKSVSGPLRYFSVMNQTTNGWQVHTARGNFPYFEGTMYTNSTDTSIHILTAKSGGSSGVSGIRLDGVDQGVTFNDWGTGQQNYNGPLYLLKVSDNITTYFTGYVGEIVIYNSILSGADITSVESYLTSRWAATAYTATLTDTVAESEARTLDVTHTLTDTLDEIASLALTAAGIAQRSDSVGLTDTVTFLLSKSLDDTFEETDSFARYFALQQDHITIQAWLDLKHHNFPWIN